MDTTGTLDEALERLHRTGPELEGWLTNHAPMAVEALVRHGQARTVHRWLDRYQDKLEDMPAATGPVTEDNWREHLGDPRKLTDWALFFTRQVEERPWRDVLAEWWPRLLPGISGAATHPVIRTGHAVRTLLSEEEARGGASTEPRRAELGHALGYWAARHLTLSGIRELPVPRSAAAGLDAVPLVADQSGGIVARLERITGLPARPGAQDLDAAAAEAEVAEVVRAATLRYATHAHGSPVMLVHAATAPNGVLRTLPALPPELWGPSLDAAWTVSAAVTAVYGPREAAPAPDPGQAAPEEIFERAVAHGDEHVIKLADTALDVAEWSGRNGDDEGRSRALSAALRSVELTEPLF
ncbi:questin oxidase family protein [Streptomyces sp. NPDC048172]|uniref:questin oxidase family protein n=1 Tax=Streptomyces sp. NPDC048172 TaxID=3365505 RepID=UPI00371035CF